MISSSLVCVYAFNYNHYSMDKTRAHPPNGVFASNHNGVGNLAYLRKPLQWGITGITGMTGMTGVELLNVVDGSGGMRQANRNTAKDGRYMVNPLIELTPEQKSFLAARLTYHTDGACAAALGFSAPTVSRWKLQPVFMHEYNNLGLDARKEAVARLQGLFGHAIDALEEGLRCDNLRTRAKYVEMALSFGGLGKTSEINVNVIDRTMQLLVALKQAGGVPAISVPCQGEAPALSAPGDAPHDHGCGDHDDDDGDIIDGEAVELEP